MYITIQLSLFKNLQYFYLKIHIEEYYDKDMTTLDRCLKYVKYYNREDLMQYQFKNYVHR